MPSPKESRSKPAARIDAFIASVVVAWVRMVIRFRWVALGLVLLLSIIGAWVSITQFSIRTSTESMLSPSLVFQQNHARFREAFPNTGGELVVVIDAASPALAENASRTLVAALRGRTDIVSSAVDIEDLPYFRKNGLLYLSVTDLAALSDDLTSAQPFLASLSSDPTLHGFENLMNLVLRDEARPLDGESARLMSVILDRMADVTRDVNRDLDQLSPMSPLTRPGDPAAMDWSDLFSQSTGGSSRTRRFVMVRPVLEYSGFSPASAAMSAVREAAVASDLTVDHGVSVRLTGSAALAQDELASVKSGMLWPSLISFLSVTLLLVFGLWSGRLIFATLSALVSGLLITAGFAFLSVGTLNLISVTFAVLFIGLSVDFGLHYGLRYREARMAGTANREALLDAAQGTGTSLVLSAAAAIIAFFAFLPTDYLGLAQLGLISGVGMIIALTLNLTLLPAILSVLPVTPKPLRFVPDRFNSTLGRLIWYPNTHPRTVAALAGGLAIVCVVVSFNLRFDTDPLSLKDPKTESMATLLDVMRDARTNPYTIDILTSDLGEAERLTKSLAALPEVKNVASFATLVPTDQSEKLQIIEDLEFMMGPAFMAPVASGASPTDLPQTRKSVAQQMTDLGNQSTGELEAAAQRFHDALENYPNDPKALDVLNHRLFGNLSPQIDSLREKITLQGPVTVSDLPDELRDRFVSADGTKYRLQVFPAADVRGGGAALYEFVDAVSAVAPQAAGAPIVYVGGGRTVMKAFLEAGAIASVFIIALILLVLRSTRAVVLVFTPVVLAGLMTAAAAVFLGQALNLANVIVLPLLVGLGVAGAIHVLGRFEELNDQGGALMGTSTPRAVTFSALTTIASFGSLGASSHLGTASMGLVLTLALSFSLFCNLWILPALIELWPGRSSNRKNA